jgi:hypothetical protein
MVYLKSNVLQISTLAGFELGTFQTRRKDDIFCL